MENIKAIKWFYDFEEAKKVASKLHKPILIQFERERCSGCKKMDSVTYLNEYVIYELQDWFVPVKLDILSNRILRSQYSAIWTPSFYVVDYKEKLYYSFAGYLNVEDFRIILRTAIVSYYLPRGKYKDGIAVLEDGIRKFSGNPRTPNLMLLLGQAKYLRNWDSKLFKASMKEIIEKFPESPEARMWPWMDQIE